MHFNLDPAPTFSYSTLGFLFIHFFILFLRSFPNLSLSLSLFFLPLLYSRPPPPSPSSFHPFTIPLPRSNVDLSNDYSKFNLSRLARGKGEEEKKKKRKEKKGLEGRPQPMTPCVQISLKI